MNELRYPIGKHEPRDVLSPEERETMIQQIAAAPAELRAALTGLDDAQIDTPYRDGGWTVRQVVHHIPDSHLNAYVRTKLALTEERPTIKPYDETAWAMLADSRETPLEISLTLLESLHARWTLLLQALRGREFSRTLLHPENGVMTIDGIIALYAWHGRHHIGHVTGLRRRMGWA